MSLSTRHQAHITGPFEISMYCTSDRTLRILTVPAKSAHFAEQKFEVVPCSCEIGERITVNVLDGVPNLVV